MPFTPPPLDSAEPAVAESNSNYRFRPPPLDSAEPVSAKSYQFTPPSLDSEEQSDNVSPAAAQLSKDQIEKGSPTGFFPAMGMALKYAGNVVSGEVQDAATALFPEPEGPVQGYPVDQAKPIPTFMPNTRVALEGNTTPYDVFTKDVHGVPGVLKGVSEGAAEMLPQIEVAGGLGKVLGATKAGGLLAPKLASAVAAGTVFGTTEDGFNPKQAAVMAAFPLVSELGGKAMQSGLGKLGVDIASQTAKKSAQLAGGYLASQAYLDITSIPDYAKMTPDERWEAWAKNFGLNLAMHIGSIPEVIEARATDKEIKQAADEATQQYRDAFWKAQAEKNKPPVLKPNEFQFTPTAPSETVQPTTTGAKDGTIPVGSAATVPLEEQPKGSEEVGKGISPPEKPADAQAEIPPVVEAKPASGDVKPNWDRLYSAEHADLLDAQKRMEQAREDGDADAEKTAKQERDDILQRLDQFDKLSKRDQGDFDPTIEALRYNPNLSLSDAITEGARLTVQRKGDAAYDAALDAGQGKAAAKAAAKAAEQPAVVDTAQRLIDLKAIPNPTPEQIAERDALQKKSDSVQGKMAAEFEALKAKAAAEALEKESSPNAPKAAATAENPVVGQPSPVGESKKITDARQKLKSVPESDTKTQQILSRAIASSRDIPDSLMGNPVVDFQLYAIGKGGGESRTFHQKLAVKVNGKEIWSGTTNDYNRDHPLETIFGDGGLVKIGKSGKNTYYVVKDWEKPSDVRTTIDTAKDTPIGKNRAGESIFKRDDGSVYRMIFDRKDKPNGYPDFGGDLAQVQETPTPKPVEAKEAGKSVYGGGEVMSQSEWEEKLGQKYPQRRTGIRLNKFGRPIDSDRSNAIMGRKGKVIADANREAYFKYITEQLDQGKPIRNEWLRSFANSFGEKSAPYLEKYGYDTSSKLWKGPDDPSEILTPKPPPEGGTPVPKPSVEPPPSAPTAMVEVGKKYKIEGSPYGVGQAFELVERVPQTALEKTNGDKLVVRVKNLKTGEVVFTDEDKLQPENTTPKVDKTKPSVSLDDQLRAAKLNPEDYPDKAAKQAALKRSRALSQGKLREQAGKGQKKKPAVEPDEPRFAITGDESPPVTVKEGKAFGLEDIKTLLNDPARGYDAKLVGVANQILDRLMKSGRDLSKLQLSVEQNIKFGSAGLTNVADMLIKLSGAADPTTFPHEVFHVLHEFLTPEERAHLNDYRLAELKKIYGDNIPPELRNGTMTTEDFLRANLPRDQYHLINTSEFLSNFAGKEALSDFEKSNDPSWWNNFRNTITRMVRAIVQTVKGSLRLRPDMRQIFDDLLSGKYQSTPEGGGAFDQEQAQAPRKLSEYEKEKTFDEPLVAQRTLATYGDIAALKKDAADTVGASEKAREHVFLPRQELLSSIASADSHIPQVMMENYKQVRALTENAGPGLRWSVIRDAWQGVNTELRRMAKTAMNFANQDEVIRSKGFQAKLSRVWDRNLEAQSAKSILETYKNQISQESGDILRQLNEQGKTEAQYEQLRSDLSRMQKMGDYGEAVKQRVNDMVNVLSSTESGRSLLNKTESFPPATARGLNPEMASVGKRQTADELYRAYLDIKESTANRSKAGLAGMVDPSLLSAADRAKLEASQAPALTTEQKALAQFAAQVLAANQDLRLNLSTLAYFKEHPEFQAQVTKVGENFRKAYEKDPNNAIRQIVKTSSRLTEKTVNAEAAWLRLNRDVMREVTKYQDLKDATTIDQMVTGSQHWRDLVNQIQGDAKAIDIPPSELARTVGNIFNEFNGKQTVIGPTGTKYDIDLGYTKASANAAQRVMAGYLEDVRNWLNDPKNADSPYRKYWEMRSEFIDSVLNVSTAINPSTTESLILKKSFGIPEFFFKGASIPQAKVAFTASSNFARAWVVGDQWYNKAQPIMLYYLRKGMESHNAPRGLVKRAVDFGKDLMGIDPHITYDPSVNVKDYQRDVLDRLASEYRHGRALAAGDRLNNGIILTPADIRAFEVQGRFTNELMTVQKNIARERVMSDNLVVDEWAKGQFGLRAPQELGARKGTTLPHEFSQRGKALASLASKIPVGDYAKLSALLESNDNFNEFVKRFIAERRADFSQVTPFEDIHKQLAEKWRNNDADAPTSIQEVIDYIDANTTGEYDKPAIQKILLGEMQSQLAKFYKNFVAREQDMGKDVTVQRVEKATAFSRAYQKDVGSSFFYDYGKVTAPEIRSMMVDSTNFHLVRLVRAMDALVKGYDEAMDEMKNISKSKQGAFTTEAMKGFRSGEDFRNWERLQKERAEAQYFLKALPQAYGGEYVPTMDLFSNFQRVTGDAVSAALSGLGTMANVSFGSPVKMSLVLGAMERSRAYVWSRATWNTIVSLSNYLYRAPFAAGRALKSAYNSPEATLKGKLGRLWFDGMTEITEGLYKQSRFFHDQYQFGLGFSNPVGYRVANILADPYSHGQGYNANLIKTPVIGALQRLGFRALSAAEAPLEVLKSYLPQFGYVASYDAAARTGGTTIDMIASQARRTFDYMEKTGKLGMFDLTNVKSPQNRDIPPSMILPDGVFFKKTANAVNAARDWWSRATDVPLNETVLNYWKKLAETKPEDRDKASFLAADVSDPEQVKHAENARAAALLSILVKDVHHASPENRPMELRRNQFLRALFPIAGWFLHSGRGTAQYLGKASTDAFNTQAKLKLMAAAGVLTALGIAVAGGEEEKEIKKLLAKFFYHEETPTNMVWQTSTPKEAAQIVAVDATSFIPMAHDMFATLVGSQHGGEGGGPGSAVRIFTLDKINALFNYYKGVVATGDPTYGLASLMKVEIPLSKTFINQMASQQGLIKARNSRILVNLYGPEELTGKETGGAYHLPTPLTPFKQDLQNAIFSNDVSGTDLAAKAFIDKAESMGRSPEEAQKLLNQALDSFNPLKAGGQKMTEQQMADFKAKLSPQQLGVVNDAATSWQNAASSLGRTESATKQERGGGLGIGSVGSGATATTSRRSSGISNNRLRRISGGRSSSSPASSSSHGLRAARLRRTVSRFKGARNRLRSHHKSSTLA